MGFFVGVVVCDLLLHLTENTERLRWTVGWSERTRTVALFGSIFRLRLPAYRGRLSLREIVKTLSLISFGVAIIMESVALPYGERIDELTTAELSESRTRGVLALSKTAEATKEARQADERAKNAELRAVQLLAEIQPRDLTQPQEREIADKLRRFSGFELFIASHWIDAEGARLARQVKHTLNRAGIGSDNPHFDMIGKYPRIPLGLFGGGEFSGSEIHVGVEVWSSDRSAAAATAKVLRSIGKLVVTTPPQAKYPFPFKMGKFIAVFVGVKPLPEVK